VALLVAAILVGATGAGPLAAQDGDRPSPREYGESGVRAGVVRIRAGSEWLPEGSGGGGGGGSECATSSIEVIVEDDFDQPVNREWRQFGSDGSLPFAAEPVDLPSSLPTLMRNFSPTGRWYAVMCDGNIRVVPEGGPAVTIAGLMQEAVNQLDPPRPDLAVVPADLHVTQLPSWLAIDPVYWTERSARVSAGRVWVVGRAAPYEVTWDTGDGETVVCDGPGTVWRAGLDPEANDCAHTYRRSSAGAPGDAFTLTATVGFQVSAETNAPGTYGPFPDIERTTTEPVQVGEIQAVND
jgi:hypothetical protein